MTAAFVADSSVAVAWIVPSQADDGCNVLLSEVDSGRSFVVPVLWAFEVANALLMLRRRKLLSADEYSRARRVLNLLTPAVDEEGIRLAANQIADLAETYSLSVYDAAYLEVATRRGLPIATRDGALNKAARRCGVTTLL